MQRFVGLGRNIYTKKDSTTYSNASMHESDHKTPNRCSRIPFPCVVSNYKRNKIYLNGQAECILIKKDEGNHCNMESMGSPASHL